VKEHVDRSSGAIRFLPRRELEVPAHQRHFHTGRNDVGVIGLDALSVGGLHHGNDSHACEQLGEDALVHRVEVLHEHVREASGCRESAEQLCKGLEPAR